MSNEATTQSLNHCETPRTRTFWIEHLKHEQKWDPKFGEYNRHGTSSNAMLEEIALVPNSTQKASP